MDTFKLSILIGTFLIVLLLSIIMVLMVYNILYKKKNTEQPVQKSNIEDSQKISNEVQSTVAFMNLLKTLVTIEVDRLIFSYKSLNKEYKLLQVDNDVKEISTNIYQAVRGNKLTDGSLMVSSKYLMDYIISETTEQIVQKAQDYNYQRTNIYPL